MLLNAINDPEQNVCLESFCLFVFDECHHCGRKHPFQRIMNKYVDTRLDRNGDRSQLPQVKHRPGKSVLLFCVPSRTITISRVFPIERLPERLEILRVPSRINNLDSSTHSKRKTKEV